MCDTIKLCSLDCDCGAKGTIHKEFYETDMRSTSSGERVYSTGEIEIYTDIRSSDYRVTTRTKCNRCGKDKELCNGKFQ